MVTYQTPEINKTVAPPPIAQPVSILEKSESNKDINWNTLEEYFDEKLQGWARDLKEKLGE